MPGSLRWQIIFRNHSILDILFRASSPAVCNAGSLGYFQNPTFCSFVLNHPLSIFSSSWSSRISVLGTGMREAAPLLLRLEISGKYNYFITHKTCPFGIHYDTALCHFITKAASRSKHSLSFHPKPFWHCLWCPYFPMHLRFLPPIFNFKAASCFFFCIKI